MLVLDTAKIPPADRAEAFQSVLSANTTTSVAVFEEPADVRAEMHVHALGAARVFTIDANGTTLRRTPRIARATADSQVCLALPMRTTNHLLRRGDDRLFGARDLMLVDLDAPYVYGWVGAGASYAFHVDQADLDVGMDTVHAAAGDLRRSPLYSLVRDHIASVMTNAEQLAASGLAAQVGQASIDLMRSLIVSAADGPAPAGRSMHDVMAPRLQAYVRQHLRDPDLGPARIAAANGISVRTLFAVYESIGVSLEQTIIEQRLEGIRSDLASPRHAHRSIAAVARAWGFTNASFVTSRFKRAFGTTPRAWRAAAAAGGPEASAREPARGGAQPPRGDGSRRTTG